MNASPLSPADPAALAEEVRSLANDAYRSLHGPAAASPDALELSRRIARLQCQIDRLAAEDLALWLENLRRRIDAPEAPLPGPRRRHAR